MNCEELRTIVGAEPDSTNPEVLAHVERCPECARYRQELQAMDRLIYRALGIEAPEHGGAAHSNQRVSTAGLWRMAASVLVAVLVGSISLWLLAPRDSFAAEVVQHVKHEQASIVRTDQTIEAGKLERVLAASRLRLKPGAARVSYAESCTFRGQQVPHLVVQTERGPVTVLVVADAPMQKQQQIDEGGFRGVIVPAPRGVIAVLGQNAPVDSVAGIVLSALEY